MLSQAPSALALLGRWMDEQQSFPVRGMGAFLISGMPRPERGPGHHARLLLPGPLVSVVPTPKATLQSLLDQIRGRVPRGRSPQQMKDSCDMSYPHCYHLGPVPACQVPSRACWDGGEGLVAINETA